MNFQIFMSSELGFYAEELSTNGVEALRGEGLTLVHEFEAEGKEAADDYFISWCDEQAGTPNKVERIDFHKAGLR